MAPIHISNIRLGHATNSSSSHSILVVNPTSKELLKTFSSEFDVKNWLGENSIQGDFGWDYFTLADREDKLQYAAILLREAMPYDTPEYILNILLERLTGLTGFNGYIDHQSAFAFPNDYHSSYPDEKYFETFKSWLLQEHVIILGGNDNNGDDHSIVGDNPYDLSTPYIPDISQPRATRPNKWVCRYDELYDAWALFNKQTGTKIRLRFDYSVEKLELKEYSRAFAPELVDMKITDYCPYLCHFCYMGSTRKGKHADLNTIRAFIAGLSDLKVFELAIGGGEPTLHPGFVEILTYAAESGLNVNFTTKNLSWLKKHSDEVINEEAKYIREAILTHARAFAVSIEKASDIYDLHKLLEDNELLSKEYYGSGINLIRDKRINLHIVMGTLERDEFHDILQAVSKTKMQATLLGYKDIGRGCNFERIDYDWWLEEVLEAYDLYKHFRVNIDTVLAEQYDTELQAAGVPKWLYHTIDGTFSAYIDAVNKRFGRASYIPDEQLHKVDDEAFSSDYNNILHNRHYNPKMGAWLEKTFQAFNIEDKI